MDIDKILKLASLLVDASRNDYMKDYMRNRYHQRRQKAIEELGGKCARCGIKNVPFHLDHIEAKKKKMRASDIHSTNDKAVENEMKNLQLLCEECHKDKTKESWDYSTPKSKHGTYWMYRKYKCRCEKCTKAYKDKLKEWRNKST